MLTKGTHKYKDRYGQEVTEEVQIRMGDLRHRNPSWIKRHTRGAVAAVIGGALAAVGVSTVFPEQTQKVFNEIEEVAGRDGENGEALQVPQFKSRQEALEEGFLVISGDGRYYPKSGWDWKVKMKPGEKRDWNNPDHGTFVELP